MRVAFQSHNFTTCFLYPPLSLPPIRSLSLSGAERTPYLSHTVLVHSRYSYSGQGKGTYCQEKSKMGNSPLILVVTTFVLTCLTAGISASYHYDYDYPELRARRDLSNQTDDANNSTCIDRGQFRCEGGECIPINYRCDDDPDCEDQGANSIAFQQTFQQTFHGWFASTTGCPAVRSKLC